MENSNQQTLNPLISIWIKPRKTIQQIVDRGPNELILILLVSIVPLVQNIVNSIIYELGAVEAIFVNTIPAIIFSIGFLYLFSALYRWTGTWLGGTGKYRNIRAVAAWANVPAILGVIIWAAVVLLVPGQAEFTVAINQQPEAIPWADSIPQLAVFAVLGLIGIALGIWTLVIFANSLAQVQGFSSAWKGLLNGILGVLIVIIPVAIIAFIVFFAILGANPDLLNPNTGR